MHRFQKAIVASFAAALVLTLASSAGAQERRAPGEGGETYSLGLPGRNLAHGGLSGGAYLNGETTDFTAYATIASYRDFAHAAYTIMGFWGELYGGYRDTQDGDIDGGARAMIMAPAFKLGGGIDYNFLDGTMDAIFSLVLPLRRGGILGHGSALRIDWLPDRGHSFNIGIDMALQRYSGKTRPEKDHVRLPKSKSKPVAYTVTDPNLEDALTNVGDAAHWINRLTVPFLDHNAMKHKNAIKDFREEMDAMKTHMASIDPLYPHGRTVHEEVRVYHEELDRAFSIAASGDTYDPGKSSELGRAVSIGAREILFDEIILRYDRLLGQRKKNDSLFGLGVNARGLFSRWVNTETKVDEERIDAVLYVFESLIEIVEENRAWSKDKWEDSRLVWIPMQYALRPDQHDTQVEMDRLIERATRHDFTNGNEVYYIINEQFQIEVQKQILAAEDYHVLWIHDFRGVDAAGDPDLVSFVQVVTSYFKAMTDRVRAYDDTGKLPTYLIVQDQFYYENNKSKRWHDLLMEPLEHKINLPKDFEWMESAIDSAQAELRNAVADSYLLQAEAREYGEDWLKNRIKVHVNITQPADMSFWSHTVLPVLGLHDNYVRDHRKISFYDVTEDDPFKGGAIYTGMGIGEHYMGATWEDRAILATGPALLDLKKACVQCLEQNGFTPDEIPHVLRSKPKPCNYNDMIAAGADPKNSARAVELHNVVGFGPKRISVFKAMIYTLMPPGSVLLMPDFVWQSPLWGSMAVGGALRGTKSLIVFPSLPNQPSPSGIPQSRARELFERLIQVQHFFDEEIAESGGMLKTGFYDLDMDVRDLRGRLAKAANAFRKYPFLVDLVHGDASMIDEIEPQLQKMLDDEGYEIHHSVDDAKVRYPQMHMKAQFYASAVAWDTFFSLRDVKATSHIYLMAWARQMRDGVSDPQQFHKEMDYIIKDFEENSAGKISEETWEKAIIYLSVGSQNMDYRGMFLDGEVVFVASRGGVLTGLFDLLHVIQSSDWVDDEAQLDHYMGSYGGFTRHLSRWATPLQ